MNQVINPWRWQDQFGFAQAIGAPAGNRTVYCAGQTAMDAEGNPVSPGDMEGQLVQALENLESVLAEAGAKLSDVVRLNYYVTDIDEFFGVQDLLARRLADAGCRPASTLLEVTRLAMPGLLVELEATAVL